mmetsp:Transcript_7113/g.8175  ORF Transcript_7113/g.8175 Transcript_7113/m.8175 type:complete len:324 (-) Transcript_7113:16-987(-)
MTKHAAVAMFIFFAQSSALRTQRQITNKGYYNRQFVAPQPFLTVCPRVSNISKINTALSSSNFASLNQLLRGKAGPEILKSVTLRAMQTPPITYLLALVASGFGFPVSEDVLCIFAGASLPTLTRRTQVQLVGYLYCGVVMSDAITFFMGRLLKVGFLGPIGERMFPEIINDKDIEMLDGADPASIAVINDIKGTVITNEEPVTRRRKRDRLKAKFKRIKKKLNKSGKRIGFVIRLSVGMRAPLMILSGYKGQVTFPNFITGTVLGATLSLTSQLLIGYSMRNSPEAIVGVVGGLTSLTAGFIVFSWLLVIAKDVKNKNKIAS